MHKHTLTVLGNEVSFKADVDPGRVERANAILEERYARLNRHGGMISKEKILTLLALTLADDYLVLREEKEEINKRMVELLSGIEEKTGKPAI